MSKGASPPKLRPQRDLTTGWKSVLRGLAPINDISGALVTPPLAKSEKQKDPPTGDAMCPTRHVVVKPSIPTKKLGTKML
ncbi:hypothetical protein RRG08_066277 [Elysia crispata]|uniref:Uncharacterized protein n=1 Tax=Elysia crispata TaxID=231223 RepID=A0AAE1B8Y1_9GAST|nr:hypothetical protein RRG08_066277 [Elysia crispata]